MNTLLTSIFANNKIKRFAMFVLFQTVFFTLTFPLLVFYGPFENVKRTVVGTAWGTLRQRYIVKAFLSDDAIAAILGDSYAVDPTVYGEEIQILNFGEKHSDRIDIYNISGKDFNGKLMIVYDPARIKVGYSENILKLGETTSSIAGRNGAVGAINAGGFIDSGWIGTGGVPTGFLLHEGKVIYDEMNDEKKKQDTVAFTQEGMLIVGLHSIADLKKMGVREAVSFGPPLIVNGKPTITKGDGGWGIAPRTAIGQRKNGEVLMLVIDGRNLDSFGATLKDVQDILLHYGAVNAANLDGGSSSTMYFNGRVINKPSDKLGERSVPSAFIVMPVENGADK